MKEKLVQQYIDWLSRDIKTLNSEDNSLITTPFLNPVNDCNQVSISYTQTAIRISDNSKTSREILQDYRINIERSPAKKIKLESLMSAYCMTMENSELVRYCCEEEFPWALHYFSIGILAIQNSFSNILSQDSSLSKSNTIKGNWKLYQRVENGFVSRKIKFIQTIKKTGASGFQHKYDFAIGRDENNPPILIKAPAELKQDNAQLMLFEWQDYLKTVNHSPLLYIIANDTQRKIDPKIINLVKTWNNTVYCPLSAEDAWMDECRRVAQTM